MYENSGTGLHIAILKCPYLNWECEGMQPLFNQMISLKLQGYINRYGEGVLPIDTTDFLSDHILFCQKNNNHLSVVAGVKSFHHDVSEEMEVEFTPISFLRKFENTAHLHEVNKIVFNCKNFQRKLEYAGSFTVSPTFRKLQYDRTQLLELLCGTTVNYHTDNNIRESIVIGLPQFKTDIFLKKWGYCPISKNMYVLDDIRLPNFGNLDATVLHLTHYSGYAVEMRQKFQNKWKERIEIGTSRTLVKKNAILKKPDRSLRRRRQTFALSS